MRRRAAVGTLLVVALICACTHSKRALPQRRPSRVVTTTNLLDGIELSVKAPTSAVAGSRLWFDVVVRNTTSAAVFWQAGGCAIPVTAAIGPADGVSTTDAGDQARWNPTTTALPAWIESHNALAASQPHEPEKATGAREMSCTANSVMKPLSAGSTLTHRGSVELRVPPGRIPNTGRYAVLVSFQPFTNAIDWSANPPRRAVEVRGPVVLNDDPHRRDGRARARVRAVRLAGVLGRASIFPRGFDPALHILGRRARST